MVTPHLPRKFHANRSSRFLVILLTNLKETNKQRNKQRIKEIDRKQHPVPDIGDRVIRRDSHIGTKCAYSCHRLQESCAIAKMTAQCALYMGALKISGLPDYAHGYYSQHFSWAFVRIDLMNVRT